MRPEHGIGQVEDRVGVLITTPIKSSERRSAFIVIGVQGDGFVIGAGHMMLAGHPGEIPAWNQEKQPRRQA